MNQLTCGIDFSFGRRIMFTLLSLYQGAVVLGTAFAADYVTFAVLRFMAGFGESGFYIALYIWGQCTSPRWDFGVLRDSNGQLRRSGGHWAKVPCHVRLRVRRHAFAGHRGAGRLGLLHPHLVDAADHLVRAHPAAHQLLLVRPLSSRCYSQLRAG